MTSAEIHIIREFIELAPELKAVVEVLGLGWALWLATLWYKRSMLKYKDDRIKSLEKQLKDQREEYQKQLAEQKAEYLRQIEAANARIAKLEAWQDQVIVGELQKRQANNERS